jgi:hypothetical protein
MGSSSSWSLLLRFSENQLLIQVSNYLYRSSSLLLYFEYFHLGSSLVEVVYHSVSMVLRLSLLAFVPYFLNSMAIHEVDFIASFIPL